MQRLTHHYCYKTKTYYILGDGGIRVQEGLSREEAEQIAFENAEARGAGEGLEEALEALWSDDEQ